VAADFRRESADKGDSDKDLMSDAAFSSHDFLLVRGDPSDGPASSLPQSCCEVDRETFLDDALSDTFLEKDLTSRLRPSSLL
jgi:hypothetical protein